MNLFSILKRKISLLILVFISLVLVVSWYRQGLMFGGSEEGLPYYDLNKFNGMVSSVWYEVGTGYPLTILLPRIPYLAVLVFLNGLGISNLVLQASTFFVIITTATFSVYALTNSLIDRKLNSNAREYVSLIAGMFYLLNPYTLTQVFARSLYAQMFSFALMPLFLFLVMEGIKKKKFYYAVLAVLVSFIFAPAFVMLTQVVVIWSPVIFYVIYYIYLRLRAKKINDIIFLTSYLISLILIWIYVHSWWLIPTFTLGGQVFSSTANNTVENIGTLHGVSAHFPIPMVLRLMQNFYFFDAKIYGDIYSYLPMQIISWLIPLCLLLGFILIKSFRELRSFAILFFIGLFVSLGSNFPLGDVFVWFFTKFIFLQAFRNPYEKFGLVFLLAYTPFFSLGVFVLSGFLKRRLKRNVSMFLIFLICGVFVWPFWTGGFAGQKAWTKVPPYYKEADGWLSRQEGDFRIMQVPLVLEGVVYQWDQPYQGIEPGEFLFTRSSIGRNVIVNKNYYNVLLQRFGNFYPSSFGPDPDISNSTFRSEKLYQELSKLGVRYLVFHNDLDDFYIGKDLTKDYYKNYLEGQEKIRKVQTFGKLDIYEVDIPKEISIIYSPGNKVSYTKLNPDFYEGFLETGNKPSFYFLSLYDPNWELLINGKLVRDHHRLFDYANVWEIDPGKHTFILRYKPQEQVDRGMKVSVLTAVFLSIYLVFTFFRKKTPSN